MTSRKMKVKQEPSRLFLGTLSASSGDLVRHLEGLAGPSRRDLDNALLVEIPALLALPRAEAVTVPLPTDMAFDVALRSYRSGSASDFSFGAFGLPMYWRPKVQLAARLYHLQSGKAKATFRVTERMPWAAYLNRVLSWRVLVGLDPPARRSDLEWLLGRAVERLVARLQGAE